MAIEFCRDGLATGLDNGTSWENAYQTLQGGVDSLGSGNNLWVSGGTITLSARIDFDNSNGGIIIGGFDPLLTGTSGSVVGRDLSTDITILDGNGSYACGNIQNQTYTLDGLKFYRGIGTGSGIRVYVASKHATLKNCLVDSGTGGDAIDCLTGGASGSSISMENCKVTNNSGGHPVEVYQLDITMDDCEVSGNAGASGGGINLSGSSSDPNTAALTNCSIHDNTSTGYYSGTIIVSSYVTLTAVKCKVYSNTGGYYGGALRTSNSTSVTKWKNCQFWDNLAGKGGAAVFSDGTNTFDNCTLADNNSTNSGGAIRNQSPSILTITNCILYGNLNNTTPEQISNTGTVTVTYSDIEGGWTGTGNVDGDPNFKKSGDDYYDLGATSVAVDSGNSGATNYSATDYLGRARVDDPGTTNTGVGTPTYSDMGAYEMQVAATPEAAGSFLLLNN